jgi:endonuclease YncB( thermonuclease family)
MPILLTALALAAAQPFVCSGLQVHDGDSIRCGSERIRIENIDAPELPDSPKCHPKRSYAWCDYKAGYAARDALAAFLSRGTVMVQRTGTDRYGRTLAQVTVNGKDAGAYLVARGLARWWR